MSPKAAAESPKAAIDPLICLTNQIARMATAEQTQASEAFFTLVASAPGMPPLAGARMFAIGVHNCPSFAVYNNSMLYDAATPLRLPTF